MWDGCLCRDPHPGIIFRWWTLIYHKIKVTNLARYNIKNFIDYLVLGVHGNLMVSERVSTYFWSPLPCACCWLVQDLNGCEPQVTFYLNDKAGTVSAHVLPSEMSNHAGEWSRHMLQGLPDPLSQSHFKTLLTLFIKKTLSIDLMMLIINYMNIRAWQRLRVTGTRNKSEAWNYKTGVNARPGNPGWTAIAQSTRAKIVQHGVQTAA